MPTWGWILVVIIAFVGGLIAGYYAARNYIMDYYKKNPPIDEQMITMMMAQMGQKPSKRKVQQIMNSMKARD